MLVKKGGITRNIDEKRLHIYKAKGYAALEAPAVPQAPAPDLDAESKALKRMTTEELTKKAAELGVDISGAATNEQRADAILAHIAASKG